MATTQLKIANMAIYEVGGSPITDIPDSNKLEGLLVDAFWQQCLEDVLGAYPWRTFKKFVALTADATYTFVDDTYTYAYELPSDWARFGEQETQAYDFAIRVNRILSNVDDMEMGYIAIPTIATVSTSLSWPVHFVDALVARLDWSIAPKLAKKGSEKIDWHARYLARLQIAMMRDSNTDQQANSRRIRHSADTDTWITSRG